MSERSAHEVRSERCSVRTDEPDVINVPTTVSVAWRSTESGPCLTFLERAEGTDTIYEYREDLGATERLVAFDDRISGRFGRYDWHPDGTQLAYLRDGNLRSYDLTLGEEQVVASSDAFDGPPQWSPDGNQLAFVSNRGDMGTDIWVVDIDGGNPERLTDGANPDDDRRWIPSWSPDGDAIAYLAAHEVDGRDWADEVHVIYLSSGRDVRVTAGLTVSSVPAWSLDGRLAFFATRVAEPWYRQADDLHVVDLERGTRAAYPVRASHQYFQQSPLWDPDGGTIYYPVRDRGEQHLEALCLHDESGTRGVSTRVTTHDGVFGAGPVRLAPDGNRFGFVFADDTTPDHPRTMQVAGGYSRPVRSPLAVEDASSPDTITYQAFDGLYINGYLYRPDEAGPASPKPALVQCHGGGHFQYGDGWHPIEQYLAAQGFVVLAIDFRGSGGYGRAFQELSIGDWHGGQIRDARAAAAFLRKLPETTDRVGIYGGSWGGLMTLHSLVQYPEVWDAGVEWYGVVDQFTDYEQADRIGRLLRERDMGGTPDDETVRPLYEAASLHDDLDRIQAPLAALHGEEDLRVPVEQIDHLRDALADSDIPFEATVYEGEGHGFRDAGTRRDAVKRTAEWFERHLVAT